MYREYSKSWSTYLAREMEFLWFGKFGRPVLLFPDAKGRFYDNEDHGVVGSLADRVDAGEIQLVLADSVDGEAWLGGEGSAGERARRHEQYDAYLRHEMIPYVHTRAQRGDLVVYGAGFGGYHAINFAGRHPDVVSRAIGFSGVYDIRHLTGAGWDQACYFNCPAAYIANMEAEWIARLSRVSWVIGTCEEDSTVGGSRDFSSLLWSKGIPNHLEIWQGQDGWTTRRENLRRFV